LTLLYNIIIHIYSFLLHLAGLFNPKAKLWVEGRKGIFQKIENQVNREKQLAWFHCASLGEFEQGRPVIEAFKERFPDFQILVTFFSPSGYEVRKNYEGADFIFYLPADTANNARKFVELTNPDIAFFIKYEYWFNYIRQLKKKQIPVIGVSSIFRPGQRFFTWYGSWQLNMLKSFARFFVQNETSEKLLIQHGINQVSVSGDTRFDRVSQIAGNAKSFQLIKKFKGDNQIIIGGSTWPPDEELILELIAGKPNGLKFIIAPHEVHNDRIDSLIKNLPGGTLRFSEIDEANVEAAKVIVIDNIGILSHLYQYGDFALIGGGFGVGIHNILEAATFGLPVIFGPNYQKFQEARELIDRRGAYAVKGKDEFLNIAEKLINGKEFLEETSRICKTYVAEKRGATAMVLQFVKELLSGKK
jgi:3-deoxy-D-manno-octulosonic-acid transferase